MAARVAFFVFTVAVLLISTSYAATNTQQRGDERIEFSYSGTMGPNRWGIISPNFSECAKGKWQSPINIEKDKVVVNKNLKPLFRDYHPASATLVNNGFNVGNASAVGNCRRTTTALAITCNNYKYFCNYCQYSVVGVNDCKYGMDIFVFSEMRYDGNPGVLVLDEKNYTLVQMHWHSPSEHRINGIQYAAEIHLVHKANDGSISVVAALYHYGHPDPLIAKIKGKLVELGKEALTIHEQAHIALGSFNTKPMRKKTHKYYTYDGSFTTPPCSQNVTWNILGKVRSISKEQVEELKTPLESTCKNNSRPVQPLNGRIVEEYDGLIHN